MVIKHTVTLLILMFFSEAAFVLSIISYVGFFGETFTIQCPYIVSLFCLQMAPAFVCGCLGFVYINKSNEALFDLDRTVIRKNLPLIIVLFLGSVLNFVISYDGNLLKVLPVRFVNLCFTFIIVHFVVMVKTLKSSLEDQYQPITPGDELDRVESLNRFYQWPLLFQVPYLFMTFTLNANGFLVSLPQGDSLCTVGTIGQVVDSLLKIFAIAHCCQAAYGDRGLTFSLLKMVNVNMRLLFAFLAWAVLFVALPSIIMVMSSDGQSRLQDNSTVCSILLLTC